VSSTRCTCIRTGALELVIHDPECKAPSHLYDEIESVTEE
jgi:hypothetical protein